MTSKSDIVGGTPANNPPPSTMPIPVDSQTGSTPGSTEQLSSQDPEKAIAQDAEPVHKQYSAFTVTEKRIMVSVGSLAAFFSPLSSSIYFPALDTIAAALDETTSRIKEYK